jgi:hypothetical protein
MRRGLRPPTIPFKTRLGVRANVAFAFAAANRWFNELRRSEEMGDTIVRMRALLAAGGGGGVLAAGGGGTPRAPADATATPTDVIVDDVAPADQSMQDMAGAMPETEAAPMDPMAMPGEEPPAEPQPAN